MALEAVHELEIQTMQRILIEMLKQFDKSFEIYWLQGGLASIFVAFGRDRIPGAPSHS